MYKMKLKSLKIKETEREAVFASSCNIYRVRGIDGSSAELALVTPHEVLFIDSNGDLSWGSTEYLEESFDILENVTEKVSIEVGE